MKITFDLVREDGRLERLCKHGVGHTVGHARGYLEEGESIHGCCCNGCCGDYAVQEIRNTASLCPKSYSKAVSRNSKAVGVPNLAAPLQVGEEE